METLKETMETLKGEITQFLVDIGILGGLEYTRGIREELQASPDVAALMEALNGLDPVIREACGIDGMFDPGTKRDVNKGIRFMYRAVNMLLIRQMLRMEGEPEENISDGLLRSLYDIAVKQVKYGYRYDFLGRDYYKGVYKTVWIKHSRYGKVVEKKIKRLMRKEWVYSFGELEEGTLIDAFHLIIFAEDTLKKQAENLMAFDEKKQMELILSMDKKD